MLLKAIILCLIAVVCAESLVTSESPTSAAARHRMSAGQGIYTDPILQSLTSNVEAVKPNDVIHIRADGASRTQLADLADKLETMCCNVEVIQGDRVTAIDVSSCFVDSATLLGAMPPFVKSVAVVHEVALHNIFIDDIIAGDTFDSMGLDGSGQLFAMGDSGVDVAHCAFADSDVQVEFNSVMNDHRTFKYYYTGLGNDEDNNGHGTHVMGTITGDGEAFTRPGIAPKSRAIFVDLSTSTGSGLSIPTDMSQQYFPLGYEQGARVFSNSWGMSSEYYSTRRYDSFTKEVDEAAYDNQDLLIIFSAGNDGDTIGRYSIGPPALAKNCIAVGAASSGYEEWTDICCAQGLCACNTAKDLSRSEGSLAYFSSQGPTIEGRIKPDIVAPGFVVQSAEAGSGCGTEWMAGTSMAAPAVTGLALLMRQRLEELGVDSPSSALMRSLLIGGAQDMEGVLWNTNDAYTTITATPNFAVGWGRVDGPATLTAGLRLSDTSDHGALEEGSRHSYTLKTTDSGRLSITLSWTDQPAPADAVYALVQDLDLVVETSETVYGGNVGSGAGLFDRLDRVNNNERVVFDVEAGETVIVHIMGAFIPAEAQSYALSVVGPVDGDLTLTPDDDSSLTGALKKACDTDHGEWNGAKCVCEAGYSGISCGHEFIDQAAVSGTLGTQSHAGFGGSDTVTYKIDCSAEEMLNFPIAHDPLQSSFFPQVLSWARVDILYSFSDVPTLISFDGWSLDVFAASDEATVTIDTSGQDVVYVQFVSRTFDDMMTLYVGEEVNLGDDDDSDDDESSQDEDKAFGSFITSAAVALMICLVM
ncbi:Peptidase S8 subtilisin-related [Carpediemonas membranifera]|uniref:Peptidase S8 subtilisin-related n=1 Tax=Carpediemonas membranifera TaxID=201153 RepID=A0A8J6ASI7_9EUKA|nr:Peptidase S8 subtilisin-related [Carpediemonas membranifera]|eukprot:KAG9393376.1 Peptidase S8 subtilisin-related [Carpediemonas membranifera]